MNGTKYYVFLITTANKATILIYLFWNTFCLFCFLNNNIYNNIWDYYALWIYFFMKFHDLYMPFSIIIFSYFRHFHFFAFFLLIRIYSLFNWLLSLFIFLTNFIWSFRRLWNLLRVSVFKLFLSIFCCRFFLFSDDFFIFGF